DDALCLLACINSPAVELVGVSVTFGNANLTEMVDIARDLLDNFHPAGDLEVHVGAAGPGHHNVTTDAVAAMLNTATLDNGSSALTIVCAGPATNVASLLTLHPGVSTSIQEVVVVAGRRPGQRFTTGAATEHGHPDLNFENDPAAFAVLLASRMPLTYAPFEVSSQVRVTETDLAAALGSGGAVGAYVARVGAPWLRLWRDLFDVRYFHPFDSLAALRVTHPELLACDELESWVALGPDDAAHPGVQGRSGKELGGDETLKPYLLVGDGAPPGHDGPSRRVLYCHTPLEGAVQAIWESILPPVRGGGGAAAEL
ncbi:Inosine/uridine-preferring nucleoside hydrolase domain-containing protein, partial [Tribonema minus]